MAFIDRDARVETSLTATTVCFHPSEPSVSSSHSIYPSEYRRIQQFRGGWSAKGANLPSPTKKVVVLAQAHLQEHMSDEAVAELLRDEFLAGSRGFKVGALGNGFHYAGFHQRKPTVNSEGVKDIVRVTKLIAN